MTWAQVDFFFPFFVFFYGILMIFVQEIPFFTRMAQSLQTQARTELQMKHAEVLTQISARKTLAWTCFFVGGLWSLQNILIS